jgi:catechol 2,3-dioxygenase-like lactoylglutathione lyase family enzyme
MIAHLSIGVRDLERSKGFYDSALAPLGYRCLRPGRTMLGYGYGRSYRRILVTEGIRRQRFELAI